MTSTPLKLPLGTNDRSWLAQILGKGLSGPGPQPEELAILLRSLSLFRYPLGSVIVKEGDRGNDLFFLYKGKLAVRKSTGASQKEVVQLKPGDFFGEIGFMLQAPRSASVVAVVEAEVFRLSCSEFHSLLDRYPDMSSNMVETARVRSEKLAEG